MWQVKPSDAANAARKASSDIASAEDGTGNAFSPPGSIQQTSATGQKNQSAGRGQSTGFQSANTGGARPITPPPTAQGSAFNTASKLRVLFRLVRQRNQQAKLNQKSMLRLVRFQFPHQ